MTVHQTAIADAPSRDAETAMLFSPFALGAIALRHRVVHAPTTRLRADPDDTPSAMMVDYYGQRASAGGLIITESAHPSYDSRGYEGAPGIYTDAHIAGWRRIADAVHAKGGRLVMQIAHDGRQSHVDLSHGAAPVAPLGRALRRAGLDEKRLGPGLTASRADDRRDRRPRRIVSPGGGTREGGGHGRRRVAQCQRLSGRHLPSGRHQQAHRSIRWIDRKPHALLDRTRRGAGLRLGARPGRCARLAERSMGLHLGQRPGGDLRRLRRAAEPLPARLPARHRASREGCRDDRRRPRSRRFRLPAPNLQGGRSSPPVASTAQGRRRS